MRTILGSLALVVTACADGSDFDDVPSTPDAAHATEADAKGPTPKEFTGTVPCGRKTVVDKNLTRADHVAHLTYTSSCDPIADVYAISMDSEGYVVSESHLLTDGGSADLTVPAGGRMFVVCDGGRTDSTTCCPYSYWKEPAKF